ncbi:MAG: hypothetical protein OXC29_24125 [Rhodococcus sp.]|nr:hypothetical protein [Rhodococcus sp. (in: high G+C Gram-positive bacteria)]
MATGSQGASSLNFGTIQIAPAEADGSAGTFVDLSPFLKNASLPISNTAGNSTGANAATTQTTGSKRPTIGPFAFELYRSPLAAGPDAILEPLALSGGDFYVRATRSASIVAAATNVVYEFKCNSLDGYDPLMIDADRTDTASVAMTASLEGGYETDDGS